MIRHRNFLDYITGGLCTVSNDNIIAGPWGTSEPRNSLAIIHAVYDKDSQEIVTTYYGEPADLIAIISQVVRDIQNGEA